MDALERRERARQSVALVGVDAGKFHHAMVARDATGRDSKPLLFTTNREGFEAALHLIRLASNDATPASVLAGIEFAGVYGATFAHFLDALGYPVVSVLGATTKAWGQAVHGSRLKTDAKDATTIVDLVSHGRYTGYPFLKPAYAQLRFLSAGMRRLTLLRAGTINRLRSVLQSVWPEYETVFASFTTKKTPLRFLREYAGPQAFLAAPRREVLHTLRTISVRQHGVETYSALEQAARTTVAVRGTEQALATEIRQLVDLAETLGAQATALEHEMAVAMRELPEATALCTIPYVQTRMAATFLGAVGDVHAYESVNQVMRLAGLNLITRESGILKGTHRISKRGRPEIRHHAYLAALGLVKRDGHFRRQFDRLVQRNGGKKKKALVAISREVLRLMFAVARDRRAFTPDMPTPPEGRTPDDYPRP